MYDPATSTIAETLFKQGRRLQCALGLQRQLVAVTFHKTEESFETAPEKLVTRAMSYCSMVRLASIGYSRKASAVQVRCPGARRALGLSGVDEEFLSGKRYLSLGLYERLETARDTSTQVSIINEEIYGFSLSPLTSCRVHPDVILVICNANQAMRMVQGFIYHRGPATTMTSFGMQGVCAELTANPYCHRTVNVSLLCSNTRYSCSWDDNELGVGVAGELFATLVDGVVQTINSAEADKNKRRIVARSDGSNLDLGVRFGCDYYSSPMKLVKKQEEAVKLPAVSLQNIQKSYTRKNSESVVVLDNIDLDINTHEFVSIIGPSGCGKSTLLLLMAGLAQADGGRIVFPQTAADDTVKTSFGYISQADTLLPWRTVLENVELGLELRGSDRKTRRAVARTLIEQVGLDGFEQCYPFELSGGMRKRVGVIRTLAYDPPVIFMDEPFVGLDVQTRDELEADILKLWQENRKTIVMVTHDLGEAITLSDRVILLSTRPARIKAEYHINIPRPRSITRTKFTTEFATLHKRIWHELSCEVATKG